MAATIFGVVGVTTGVTSAIWSLIHLLRSVHSDRRGRKSRRLSGSTI